MKKLMLAFLLGTVLMTVVSGCRTAHGFGEDMQSAGDKIQQKTNLSGNHRTLMRSDAC